MSQLSRKAVCIWATAGPATAEVRLAPVVLVLSVSEPLIADAGSAGEADAAVDDEEAPMRAVIQPGERVPGERVVALDLRARLLHALQILVVDSAAARPVEQDVDLHAGSRPFGEGLGELLPHLSRPVDVVLERDGPLRPPNGFEHRRKDLISVEELDHVVPVEQRRAQKVAHRPDELGVADGIGAPRGGRCSSPPRRG